MRSPRFHIVDVFTDEAFGGNPLAVVPDARALDDGEMHQIAAEFGFSETTFVLPPRDPTCTRRVRIFTPRGEIPFAGHPNVGTAHVLVESGYVPLDGEATRLLFEEDAGTVPVTVRRDGGSLVCGLEPPQALVAGEGFPVADAARLLQLSPDDLSGSSPPPVLASVGLPFLFVEVNDLEALGRAATDERLFAERLPADRATGVYLYVRLGEADVRARMFAPLYGVPEDPATGSATCALAGLLARAADERDGRFAWSFTQGVEMGRPSRLRAGADKLSGEVTRLWLEGRSVPIAEGTLRL